jgi:predicted ABC-type ATPase
MFAGPNGSGKSSLYAQLVEEGHFHPTTFINADEIQNRLDTGAPLRFQLEPGTDFIERLRSSPFIAHGMSRDDIDSIYGDLIVGLYLKPGFRCGPYLSAAIADPLRTIHIEERRNFAFETMMSHESKLDMLAVSRQGGYRNYLYFVTTGDPAINVERVRQRVAEGGHPVPPEKVVERYERSMALLPAALRLCDRAYLFDNSGVASRLVASVIDGVTLRLESTSIPLWVERLLP